VPPCMTLQPKTWRESAGRRATTLRRSPCSKSIPVAAGYEREIGSFTMCVREAAADQARRRVSSGLRRAVLVKLHGCMGGPYDPPRGTCMLSCSRLLEPGARVELATY
jgi:hypothetical protein